MPRLCTIWALALSASIIGLAMGETGPAALPSHTKSAAWPTHSHDPQHTGISSVSAQPLQMIRWQTPVDLHPKRTAGDLLIHYGSPLVTPRDTVIVPVKVGINNFRVEAHKGRNGLLKWTMDSDYIVPGGFFTPSFGPVLSKDRLALPAAGGTVLLRESPDHAHGRTTRLSFYNLDLFNAHTRMFSTNLKINTPITADSQGNLFFGFEVLGPLPIQLQSGIARIGEDGTGSWISALAASGDFFVNKAATNCAPALSRDEHVLYMAFSGINFGAGDLVALNADTLQPMNSVRFIDPATQSGAAMSDWSSSTPTVGPDGDVFFGVLEDGFDRSLHHHRGWLLHYNADLTQEKIPGGFGWDDTASIVDASLVSSYEGSSKYLVMTKFNNYATSAGDGVNRIAILDPNDTMPDDISGVPVMKEVLSIRGATPDPNFPNLPGAVREWCINTAAVDPFTKSILVNSEDGKLYRWDLTTNSFSESLRLTRGIGEAYTPMLIGADGKVYAINAAILFAVGGTAGTP